MDFKLLIRRFFAFVIDWNIMFGVAVALMFYCPWSNPEYLLYPSIKMLTSAGFLLGLIWLPLYCLFKDCLFGRRSLGKLICGLMIQDSETGGKASFGRLILRNVTYVIVQIEGIVVLVNKGKAMTSRASDFKGDNDKIAVSLAGNNDAVVFVIKKNTTTLTKLTNWLVTLNADPVTKKIDMPMLMIDDEADNASINTSASKEDPTKINKLIRELANVFTKSNYVGFTATPFANVFIDPDLNYKKL